MLSCYVMSCHVVLNMLNMSCNSTQFGHFLGHDITLTSQEELDCCHQSVIDLGNKNNELVCGQRTFILTLKILFHIQTLFLSLFTEQFE